MKVGAGQASSRDCLNSFIRRWIAWAGIPVSIVCDRGLHNRGVFQQYMDEHGIQVYHVPLESPESLGRTERHGGLLKAMYRRVASEVGAVGREQVEQCLNQVLMVKNDSSRVGGFSPAQWVLGRAPRSMASAMSEEQFAELGAIEARHDPSSIFALQHMARIEAQKAYVHLDCSRRVQRALTKNASAFPREFSIGDLVTFRRDNQRGGTSWSPTSRVIGHEGPKNLWLLCGNVPVLVASQNVRIASPSEALAQAVLNGDPIVPADIVNDGGQQSFLDARRVAAGQDDDIVPSPSVLEDAMPIRDQDLPPVPEEHDEELTPVEAGDDSVWNIRPGIFDGDDSGDDDGGDDELIPDAVLNRRRPVTTAADDRNVRPRTEVRQPESERGTSLMPSRRESSTSASASAPASGATAPRSWPNIHSNLDDLPQQLREHFARAQAIQAEDQEEARAMFSTFLSQQVEGVDEEAIGKKVLKVIHFESAPPDVQEGLRASRAKEWNKFVQFAAAIPVTGREKESLLSEGHTVVPSKWVDTDKAEHKKGSSDYTPVWKSRLVSCGNYETTEGLRSDSPTADIDLHLLIAIWASCHGIHLHSADVTNAYFQARPLDRVLLMSQPRGGLPGVDPEALLLIRVPIYGLTDSGRGFWLQLDEDARTSGFNVSHIYPALYFLPGSDGDCAAVMASHVDDLLYAYLPEGEDAMKKFLSKFDLGSTETDNFRYCGKQFARDPDGTITIDVRDNTRRVRGATFGAARRGTDPLTKEELTTLRSVTGSLSWIARQGRPDLGYRVSRLQSSVKNATIATLADANRCVALAHQHADDVKLRFPVNLLKWEEIALLTVTDASFSNEANYRSQQGRFHFVTDFHETKDPKNTVYRVLPLSFGSTTIRRVCRSTLQAETYSLQHGLEAGDKLRGVIAELKGQIRSRQKWEEDSRMCIPHLAFTDCRSLADHLAAEIPARVQDKRLGIELTAIHDNLWRDGQRTWISMKNGGDCLEWISTDTMVSDCLTKSMKPDFLLRVLRDNAYRVQKHAPTKR